jgi:hypothetical protein
MRSSHPAQCCSAPLQPQDLFKSQMQAQMLAPAAGAGGAAAAAPVAPKYAGTLDCARTILRERGVGGVFQGVEATVYRNFVGVCAYFYFYEAVRMWQAGDKPVSSLSSLQVLLAGGCGGCVTVGLRGVCRARRKCRR